MSSIEDTDSALQIVEAGRVRVLARLREAIEDQVSARADLIAVDAETVESLVEEAFERADGALWRISLAEGAADLYGVSVRDALADPALAAAEQLIGTGAGDGEDLWSEPWEQWATDDADPEFPAFDPEPVVPEPPAADPAPAPEPVAAAPAAPVAPEPAPAAAPAAAPEPAPVAPEPVAAPAPVVAAAAPAVIEPLLVPVVHRGGIDSIKNGDKDIELRISEDGLDVLTRSDGAALGRLDWTVITGVEVLEPKRRRKRKPRILAIHTAGGDATFELAGLSPEQIDAELEPALATLRRAGRLAG